MKPIHHSYKIVTIIACAGFLICVVPVSAENTDPPVPGGDPAETSKSDRGPGGPAEPGGPRGGKGKWKRGGPGGPGHMFEQADADGDGKVTKEEFVAAAVERAGRMFEHMDEDQSGDVTKEEIKSVRDRFEGGRHREGGRPGGFGGPGGSKRPSES